MGLETLSRTFKKKTLRSCVMCKGKAEKDKLYRFVKKPSGGLLLDKNFKLPGRGAYLHLKCVNKKSSYKLLYSLKENLNDTDVRSIDLEKIIGIEPANSNSAGKRVRSIKPIFR